MRIIGGERRGKKLAVFEGGDVRPTGDRARAAIFNILAHQSWVDVAAPLPHGARVADIACGTGALSAESLSRGAVHALLLDNDARSLKLAEQNIRAIDARQRTRIEYADAAALPKADGAYDVIFCDPPYGKNLADKAIAQLNAQGYLHNKTLIVVETGRAETLPLPPELKLLDSRSYGAAQVWFLCRA